MPQRSCLSLPFTVLLPFFTAFHRGSAAQVLRRCDQFFSRCNSKPPPPPPPPPPPEFCVVLRAACHQRPTVRRGTAVAPRLLTGLICHSQPQGCLSSRHSRRRRRRPPGPPPAGQRSLVRGLQRSRRPLRGLCRCSRPRRAGTDGLVRALSWWSCGGAATWRSTAHSPTTSTLRPHWPRSCRCCCATQDCFSLHRCSCTG